MGLLDKAFALPRLSGQGPVADNLINYAVAPAGQVINESFDAMNRIFGGVGPFTKLNESAPTFDVLGANAAFRRIEQQDPYYTAAVSLNTAETSSFSAAQAREAIGDASVSSNTDHKVKLVARITDAAVREFSVNPSFPFEPLTQAIVEFDNMPEVSENRSAEYESLAPPQLPGEFQKYKGTKAVQWTITGTFTCRTRQEAFRNYVYLNNLRSWTVSYFGEAQLFQFDDKLGAPPPVLDFSGWRGLVGTVPVVVTNLQWVWPRDCDWIPTGIKDKNGAELPFPTVMNVTINLVESFSARQFNNFNLVEFRNGNMIGAFQSNANPTIDAVERSEAVGGNQVSVNNTPTPEPAPAVDEARRFLRANASPKVAPTQQVPGNTAPQFDEGTQRLLDLAAANFGA